MNTSIKSLAKLGLLTLMTTVVGATSAWAQFTDTQPPTLVSATFTPNPVDVTGGDASVTLALHLTDDLSGIDFSVNPFSGYVTMSGPGGQFFTLYSWTFNCTIGNPGDLDTVWESTFTVFEGTQNGDWTLSYLALYDKAGNMLWLDANSPVPVGPLTINSFSDTTPPVVSEPLFTTDAGQGINSIDTSASGQSIRLQLHITDDISGFGLDDGSLLDSDQFQVFAQNVSNGTYTYPASLSRLSGDRKDAIWEASFWFPQYSPTGYWNINLTIRDNAKNYASYNSDSLIDVNGNPSQIQVFSDPTDITPPTISALSLSPITIDTSAADATVNTTVTVADDLSGMSYVFVYLISPSGAQQRYIYCAPTTANFLGGDLKGSTTFPRYSEAGTWKVSSIYLVDNVNNTLYISNPAAQGLSATLNVILPSLDTDGSVDAAGGTVEDAVFGERASITIPPGAVAGNTTAAIDVLTSPLDVPLPTGFAGANTYYVNIHLDPEPNYPLSPPGLTVVLPLTHPMTPGTPINLFRVNTTTGLLEPAISVFGGPVVGSVDAGGLSATFTGVSRLSTVVGLLPDPVITWANPADIAYGTALSVLQLNATANVPGQFAYTPPAGTVLNAGPNQKLTAVFTPDDTVNYHEVTNTVTINVLDAIQIKPTGYPLVSSRRVSSTVWEYVYKFQIKNNSSSKAYNVTAQLKTWPSQVSVTDGAVNFGNVNPGQTLFSQDTFTVRIDRLKPVQNSELSWLVTYAYSAGGSLTTTVTLPLKQDSALARSNRE
jgi:hypothetical protein